MLPRLARQKAKAIDEANDNDVIQMQQDVVETVEIPKGKTLTIDLNGCKLSGTTYLTIDNYGVLNLQDTKGGGEVIGTYYTVWNNEAGTLNVENDATIRSTAGDIGYYRTAVYNEGNVNISGGKLLCVNDELWYHAPVCNFDGTVSITGGIFSKKPDNSFISNGYAANQNADGTWTVTDNAS